MSDDLPPEPPTIRRPIPVHPNAPRWTQTPAAKVAMILGLLLLMEIPLQMVAGLIHEREDRQAEVLAGFRRGWGPEQTVAGPMLMVPYSWAAPVARPVNTGERERMRGWARLSPSRLHVGVKLKPETRRRGLFQATVYTAGIDMSGTVTIPALAVEGRPDTVIDWAGARVILGAADLRGAGGDERIDWNGAPAALAPSERAGCDLAFLETPANLTAAPAPGTIIAFRTALSLRGTQAFRMAPGARRMDMRVTSPWPTPSFVGATLPLRYETRPDGFSADWEEAAPTGTGWQLTAECGNTGAAWSDADSQIGVTLADAVPTYVLVDRAAKYAVLFLALTFLTLFLFETLSGARIHLVQYGMVGLSLSLFALLLISIAEPLGFTASYAISALAVIAQASLYTLSVVRRRTLAAIFTTMLAGLFAFLYIVLNLDSLALLGGTVALFATLSAVMLATRRVNWAAVPVAA